MDPGRRQSRKSITNAGKRRMSSRSRSSELIKVSIQVPEQFSKEKPENEEDEEAFNIPDYKYQNVPSTT